jgi:hypothetical protein
MVPIGDVSRTSARYPLYDADNRQVGELIAADIEIGALLHHIPISSVTITPLAEVLLSA